MWTPLGPTQSVLIRGVSLFQGLCLRYSGCPHFMGVCKVGFHSIRVHKTYRHTLNKLQHMRCFGTCVQSHILLCIQYYACLLELCVFGLLSKMMNSSKVPLPVTTCYEPKHAKHTTCVQVYTQTPQPDQYTFQRTKCNNMYVNLSMCVCDKFCFD